MKEKKVIIVGAGIVGLSTAYYLNKAGCKVTIIEQNDGSNNCSYGNAGYVSPSHLIPLASPGIINQGLKWMLDSKSPFYIKPRFNLDLLKWGLLFKKASTDQRVKAAIPVLYELTVRSQLLYEEILEDEKIEAGYHKPGLLIVCQKEETLRHEIELVEIANRLGLSAYQIDRTETEKLEPNLQYQMAGAVYFDCDAWMTPHRFMSSFKALLSSRGVQFQFNTEVTDIKTQKGKIHSLTTKNEEFTADEFVLTSGAWTPLLMKKIGVFMPLQAGKGYSFLMQPEKMPKLPSILAEGKIATSPMLDGLRIAGTMELAGINHKITRPRVDGIIESVKEAIPTFQDYDFSKIEPWAGLRPVTPDGLPYIGRVSTYKNLSVGTGHAMLGWTLGPITGQLLAEDIIDNKSSYNSPLLNVERYAR